MNKAIVIYESKYGFTKRYAKWIAEALSCPVCSRKDFSPRDFTAYDVIIYGGGLYAGGVRGIKLITRNRNLLAGKKLILFTCGLADPEDPDNVSHIREGLVKTLPPEIKDQVRLFHLRGGIDYAGLGFIHKSMMSMMHNVLLKKESHTLREEDRLFLETYGKYIDFTDRNSIQSLIDYALLQ